MDWIQIAVIAGFVAWVLVSLGAWLVRHWKEIVAGAAFLCLFAAGLAVLAIWRLLHPS